MEILVVEDDPVIGKSVLKGLTEAGHRCIWTKNGTQGLEFSRSQQYDVIILDLLIPEIPGLEILDTVRSEGIRTPIIVLTAKGSVEDRVNGLRKGADDYVVKPFFMAELLERIEAVRRRSSTKPAPLLDVGDLSLDLSTRRVIHSGVEIDLTPTEFSVLEMLMRHAGEVVTRKMLCESLWESDWEGTTNVIEVHINRLRGKLQRGSKEPLIHTIRDGVMHFARLNTPFRTLRVRLLIWISVGIFLMVGITMLVIRAEFQRALFDEFDLVLKARSADVSTTLRDFGNEHVNWEKPLNRKAHRHIFFIEVFDETGRNKLWTTDSETFPDDNPANVPPLVFPPDPADPSKVPFALSETDNYRLIIRKRKVEADENPKRPLWFRIGISKEPLLTSLAHLDRIMFFAGLGIIVATPLGAYMLAGRATRPLAKIIATTARLNPENLHERLHIRGTNDELDQLSETINGMLDRIASYIDRHRDFIADAAHELRSPLTAIRSSVEVALNRPRGTEEYQTLLYDVMEECSGLAILVNRLLFLAEGDAGRLATRDQTSSLEKLVRESVDMFQAVAETRGVDLVVEFLDPAVVRGDELHLRQVVRNLIDNAVKFTKGPGKVSVAVHADAAKKQVRLTVSDTGRGIPAEDLTRIFDRFYRSDKARCRHDDEGGFGLGLSICHAVVKSLEGDIQVESELGRGTTFTVTLPLLAESYDSSFSAAPLSDKSPTSLGIFQR